MTPLTPHLRTLFLAQYIGQEAEGKIDDIVKRGRLFSVSDNLCYIDTDETSLFYPLHENTTVLLRKLNSLTDEEVVYVYEICYPPDLYNKSEHFRETALSLIEEVIVGPLLSTMSPHEAFHITQYLTSRGFLTSFHGHSPEQLIEMGLARYKE